MSINGSENVCDYAKEKIIKHWVSVYNLTLRRKNGGYLLKGLAVDKRRHYSVFGKDLNEVGRIIAYDYILNDLGGCRSADYRQRSEDFMVLTGADIRMAE